MKLEERVGLCHRCEFRAQYLEEGHGPRMECKANGAVGSCYMYKPVKPLAIRNREGDERYPIPGGIFSARVQAIKIPEELLEISLFEYEKSLLLFWQPKTFKERKMAAKKKIAEEVKPATKKTDKAPAKEVKKEAKKPAKKGK